MEPNDNTFVSTVLRVETDPLTSRTIVTHISNHAAAIAGSVDAHWYVHQSRTAETEHPINGLPSMVLSAQLHKLIGHHVEFETAEDGYNEDFDCVRILRAKDLGVNPNIDVTDPRFRKPVAEHSDPEDDMTEVVFSGELVRSLVLPDGSHSVIVSLPGYGGVEFIADADADGIESIAALTADSYGQEVTVLAGPYRKSLPKGAMRLIRILEPAAG